MQILPLEGLGQLGVIGFMALLVVLATRIAIKWMDRRPGNGDKERGNIIHLYQRNLEKVDKTLSKLGDELREVGNNVKEARSSAGRQEGYLRKISDTLIRMEAKG